MLHRAINHLGDEDGYFDPADPSVEASLQGCLQEINNLFSTNYELNLQAISSDKPISYAQVHAKNKE